MSGWGQRDFEELRKVGHHLDISNERLLEIVFLMRDIPDLRQIYKMFAMVGIMSNQPWSATFSPDMYAKHAGIMADAMILEDEIRRKEVAEEIRRERDRNTEDSERAA